MRQLTQEMAVQPAMLQYLDNRSNTKRGPQQNFARELMELFTMGVGNYSETDVSEAARAWTGHTIGWPVETYTFNANNHDTGSKTIFGVTKNWDGPDVVDAIFTMPVPRAAGRELHGAKPVDVLRLPRPFAQPRRGIGHRLREREL